MAEAGEAGAEWLPPELAKGPLAPKELLDFCLQLAQKGLPPTFAKGPSSNLLQPVHLKQFAWNSLPIASITSPVSGLLQVAQLFLADGGGEVGWALAGGGLACACC